MPRRLLIATSVLIVIVAAAYVAVNRVLAGDLVRSTLEQQLSTRLQQPVRIGAASASIFPTASLDLHDVTIGRPASVTVARLQLVTGLRGLFSRRVEEAEVRLVDGQVAWPLPFAIAPAPPPGAPAARPPFTIGSVRRIVFRNVTLVTALPPIVIDVDAALDGDRLSISHAAARSGRTRLEATGAIQSLARLQGHLDLKGELVFAGYDARDLAARLAISSSGLSLSPLTFAMFGGRFTGRLDADLHGAVPQVRINGDVGGANAAEIVKALGSPGTLSGRLGGRLALAASGSDGPALLRSSHGTIDATVRDGALPHLDLVRSIVLAFGKPSGVPPPGSGSTFSTLGGDFALANETLTSNNLSMTSRDFDLAGRGVLHADSGAVQANADVILSKELTAQSGTDLRRYAQEDGRVVVPVTIGGTLEHPTVFVDIAAASRRALENEIRRRARDFLGGLFKKKK